MPTKPLPEIARTDLDAVRRFLTAGRDEGRPARAPRPAPTAGIVPLSHGIARARSRPASRPDA